MMRYVGLNVIWENIKTNFPIIDDLAEIASDGSNIVSALKSMQNLIIKKKIKIFVENLEKTSNSDIESFILSLENDESKKTIFLESISKVIDLDDSLQIYILVRLTKNFITNGKLNYYEKSLYYGINQISEDDFAIYYCFYSKNIMGKEMTRSFYIEYELENKEVIEVVLKKFISFGIIKDATTNTNFSIELSEFSKELYQYLADYFDTQSVCDEWMYIDEKKVRYQRVKMSGL